MFHMGFEEVPNARFMVSELLENVTPFPGLTPTRLPTRPKLETRGREKCSPNHSMTIPSALPCHFTAVGRSRAVPVPRLLQGQ